MCIWQASRAEPAVIAAGCVRCLVVVAMLALSLYSWFEPHRMGYWPAMLVLTYFAVVIVIDVEHRLIMHPVSLAGGVLAAAIGVWLHGAIATAAGGAAGFVLMLALYVLGALFSRWRDRRLEAAGRPADNEEALGWGDVMLATVLGLLLGWPLIWLGLLLGILIGGVIGLMLVLASAVSRPLRPAGSHAVHAVRTRVHPERILHLVRAKRDLGHAAKVDRPHMKILLKRKLPTPEPGGQSTRRPAPTRRSGAQAMAEFALALPIMLLVMYGLIETGRVVFIYASVVSAARQAARYGSVSGVNGSAIPPWRTITTARESGRPPTNWHSCSHSRQSTSAMTMAPTRPTQGIRNGLDAR